MRCVDVIEKLNTGEPADSLPVRSARAHAEQCADCSAALRAIEALHGDRTNTAPPLAADSFARALARASLHPVRAAPRRSGFWLGAGVGAALAASLAITVSVLWLEPTVPSMSPVIALALDETRDVTIALDSSEELAAAEIRVELTGAVGLQGYANQRELRWVTALDRGTNQLTLPLVGLGTSGGQVTVEVQHGAKRRSFVFDVRPASSPDTAQVERKFESIV